MIMNTIGFYLEEYRKGDYFVCFKACFADLQRINLMKK